MAGDLRQYVFQDWRTNAGSVISQTLAALFRLAQFANKQSRFVRPFVKVPYFVAALVTGFEIETGTAIGPRLRIFHPHSIVINAKSQIGSDCTLRHGVTIGNKGSGKNPDLCPVLGDRVDIGAGASIIGPITIGDDVTIGIGSVIVKSVPAGSTVVGNPARIVESTTDDIPGKGSSGSEQFDL